MKKIISSALCLIFYLQFSFSAYTVVDYIVDEFGFMPNGQAYHYFARLNAFSDFETYDGNENLSASDDWFIRSNFGRGVGWGDGFIRYTINMNGNKYLTNHRYKLDNQPNFEEYPETDNKIPLFLTFKNQSGRSVLDEKNKTITLYIKKGNRLSLEDINVELTDYGRKMFTISGCDKDAIFFSNQNFDIPNYRFEEEAIDLTKDTYIYGNGYVYSFKYRLIIKDVENPNILKPIAIPKLKNSIPEMQLPKLNLTVCFQ